MRILNRPMFKYGGPIKEGVMHGMRNNYQSGQLVRPGPGRPGYQGNPYSTNYNLIDWKNANRPYRPLNITNISDVGGSASNATKIQRAKNLLKSSKFSERGGYEALKKYIPKVWSGIKSGVRLGVQRFPIITLGAAGEYVTRPRDVDKLVYEQEDYGPWEGRLRKTFDPTYNKKWMKAAEKYYKDKKLAKDKITTDKIIPSDKPEHLGLEPYTDPDKAKKLAKQKQNERLKSYLDMMGYDSAKKTALSDALIDASAIVQQGTEEAGSLKEANWGKLINQAIQTTSRRLDKPAQIREAVGLMATKAAIQKDMTAEENKLAKELTTKRIEKLDEELKGNSFTENKVLTAKSMPGQPGYDAAVELTKGTDFKGNLVTSTDWTESLEDMQDDPASVGLNEKQLIEKYTNKLIEGKEYEDGDYTVGDNLVTIKDSIVVKVR